jgi:hypothetical protein
MMRPGTQATVGVALSATDVVIADARGTEVARASLEPPVGDRWPALQEALQQFRARQGGTSLLLRVALLPPLAEVRMVPLPPLDEADARRLLGRAAGRHFLEARETPVIGVAPARSGGAAAQPGALIDRLAAAVATPVLARVRQAALAAGCTLEVVVPAVTAWSRGLSPTQRGLLVSYAGQQELIEVHAGAPCALRRFREAGDEPARDEAVRAVGPVATVSDPLLTAAKAMAAATTRGPWPLSFDLADRAANAATPDTPRWVAPVVVLAALAAVAALGLEWRTRATLDQLRAERAALEPQLARTAPQRLHGDRVRVLRAVAATTSQTVSSRLAAVSTALPDAAYLTRVRVRGDSMTLEGRAVRAGAVWAALSGASAVGTLTATSPVRRETAVDGVPLDRFSFTLSGAGKP